MYTIIENQVRPDGIINSTKETRASFATAMSFYYERASKMSVTDLYTKVYLLVLDEHLNPVLPTLEIDTLYKAEVEE